MCKAIIGIVNLDVKKKVIKSVAFKNQKLELINREIFVPKYFTNLAIPAEIRNHASRNEIVYS